MEGGAEGEAGREGRTDGQREEGRERDQFIDVLYKHFRNAKTTPSIHNAG